MNYLIYALVALLMLLGGIAADNASGGQVRASFICHDVE